MKRKEYSGIKRQMVWKYFVLIGTFTLIILYSMRFYFATRFMEHKVSLIDGVMTTVTDSVEGKISEINSVAHMIRNSGIVRKSIEDGVYTDYAQQLIKDSMTYDIKDIFLLDDENNLIDDSEEKESGVDRLPGYKNYLQSNRESFFSGTHAYSTIDISNDMMLKSNVTYYFKLRDSDTQQILGTVGIVVGNNYFLFDKKELIQSEFQKFYLVDKEMNLISTGYTGGQQVDESEMEDLQDVLSTWKEEKKDYFELNSSEMCFLSQVGSYPDWYLIGIVDIDQLNKLSNEVNGFITGLGMIVMLLAAVLTSVIANQISRPLSDMAGFMEKYRAGKTKEALTIRAKSKEVVILQNSINRMLERIDDSIATIVYEQEQNKKAEVEKVRYQLQSLQQQINPHFLYNTLNVIRYLALEEKGEEIASFVQNFTLLLRATLGDAGEETTIRQEIEFLNAYIHIMEYRYKDMFEFHVNIDEEIYDCKIPQLLLQPIVENALIHGGLPCGHLCVIEVKGYLQNGELHIEIGDNGVGISREKLESILEKRQNFNGIALKNVNERLVLVYGSKSALHFESEENVGTTVSFVIPMEKERENEKM